ncbi:MAG: pimeloyl-ACP methyl ester carboxylesterase [Paracoccaceae bacterium]|jgi:pimeloyl-ACP methyl ester carboxylesterase
MTEIVLIHGAWQGGWVWADVVPTLTQAGHSCHAVDLPGSAPGLVDRANVTFRDQVAFLEDLIADIDKPVVVIAHSGGGLAASQLAEDWPDRVAGIVYVAGIMMPDGTRFAELVDSCKSEDPSAVGVWPYLEHLEGMSAVPEAAAVEIFFHDGEPGAAARAAAMLTPQSNAARDASPHVTADRFGTVPRIYIEALKDRSVVPFVQRRMQELVPGAVIRSIDTGHAPMVADAALLSEMLVEAVRDLDAG